MRASQNLHYLVAYSLWADHFYLIGIRPQRIPCLRIVLKILPTPHIVDHGIRDRIVEHPVNGEVASSSVLFRGREGHRIRATAIQISAVGAKGSDLKFPLIFKHTDDPKLGTDRNCASKNLLDFFRTRVGGNVDIFRRETEESIPDASTGKIRNMPVV